MWSTFGGGASGGGGMGGGGSGRGVRMFTRVHRAVRSGGGGGDFSNSGSNTATNNRSTTTTKPNNNKSNHPLSLSSSSTSSSSPFSLLNIPACVAATAPYWAPCTCINCNGEFDWECVDGVEDERENGSRDDPVFGEVPSPDEVQQAVCSLQQVIDPASFSQFIRDKNVYDSEYDEVDKAGSELDWMEPSMQGYVSRTFHSPGPGRVYDAFHLLQTDPSVQRMVISLSSDKAVWEAVLNNEVVRELRDSLSKAGKSISESSEKASEGSNAATDILSWIFVNTKAKVMELVDKITKLVNQLFQSPDEEAAKGEPEANFQKTVKSSLLLSVVVLLIVVVSRVRQA